MIKCLGLSLLLLTAGAWKPHCSSSLAPNRKIARNKKRTRHNEPNPNVVWYRSPSRQELRMANFDNLPPPNKDFTEALTKLGLIDFLVPICDFGYYGWVPKDFSYCSLGSLSAEDIESNIDLTTKPKSLVNLQELNATLPYNFLRLSLKHHTDIKNSYPFGQDAIAALHVASLKQPGIIENIDFLFGSYTMHFLGTGPLLDQSEDRFVVARVPGTKNTILVTRYRRYSINHANVGSQFERKLLGEDPFSPFDLGSIEHVQLIKIGNSNVIVAGEVDAMDGNELPTEIKLASSDKRRVRTTFQMISTASLQICRGDFSFRGKQQPPRLFAIQKESLVRYGSRIEQSRLRKIGELIQKRVYWLEKNCPRGLKHGQVKELFFEQQRWEGNSYKKLKWKNSTDITIAELFPDESVVQELLRG